MRDKIRGVGGLLSLAGLDLGASGSRRQEFVAYLQSRELAKEFVEIRELMQLFYASHWDRETKTFKSRSRDRPPTMADTVNFVFGLVDPRPGVRILAVFTRNLQDSVNWCCTRTRHDKVPMPIGVGLEKTVSRAS